MAWSDAARAAALEARRMHAKGKTIIVHRTDLRRPSFSRPKVSNARGPGPSELHTVARQQRLVYGDLVLLGRTIRSVGRTGKSAVFKSHEGYKVAVRGKG